jgi:glycosyltransferase involved in cell wall biosynthesis
MTDNGADQRPVIVYVINSFDQGGAEAGLVALVKGGLFANCRLRIVALARGNGGLETQLCEVGHKPKILIDRVRMRTRDMPGTLARLWRFIGKSRPHIVIASLPQANLLARLCVLFRKQVTFVSFEHNSHLAKRIYEVGYRLTSWRVDWLFADAASTMKIAGERLYRRTPEKQTIVPLVSFVSAANRSYAFTSNKPFHVVNAARFTSTKNQAALIEAVAILSQSNRDVALTLYGDGPEREACQALAARLGIASRVHFPGFVPDWPGKPADLFVLTSKHEGLCIVVLEAMHAGIPVAAPMIGGLRDYAAPEVMQSFASLDPHTIASTILSVMNDRASLQAMVKKAAEMIDRRFGAEAVQKVYDEINQALIRRAVDSGPHAAIVDGREARLAHMSGRLE